MTKYCDVKPILHLLADKDLLDTVNVGAVLQALQHGLYNGEVAPVVHAKWIYRFDTGVYQSDFLCSNCYGLIEFKMAIKDDEIQYKYCPHCGAKMDEKEGNI